MVYIYYVISICVLMPVMSIGSYILAICVHSSRVLSSRKDNYIVYSKCAAMGIYSLLILPFKLVLAFSPSMVSKTVCLFSGVLPEYLSSVIICLHFVFVIKKALELRQNRMVHKLTLAFTLGSWLIPAAAFLPMTFGLFFAKSGEEPSGSGSGLSSLDTNDTKSDMLIRQQSLCLSKDWIPPPFLIAYKVLLAVSCTGATVGYMFCMTSICKVTKKIIPRIIHDGLQERFLKTTRCVCCGFCIAFLVTAVVLSLKGAALMLYESATSDDDQERAMHYLLLTYLFQWLLPAFFIGVMFVLFAELRLAFKRIFMQCAVCRQQRENSISQIHIDA